MNTIKHAGLVLAAGIALMPAMAHAFDVNFTATSSAGLPVTGHIDLVPDSPTVTNDVAADGTLHQHTSGDNAEITLAWTLEEAGGQSLYASNDRNNFFQIDAFLHPDGSSELTLVTTEYSRYQSAYQDTTLSFTLTCACSSLYTTDITAATFAHYDAIKDGLAKHVDTYFTDWPDGTTTSDVQTHVVKFATAAVPEPASVALMLAGGAVLWGRRRLNVRVGQ